MGILPPHFLIEYLDDEMRTDIRPSFGGFLCIHVANVAMDHPTYQSAWQEATSQGDCSPSEYTDFILLKCDAQFTLWYFTKPSHSAHPGVIKRVMTQRPDGAWEVSAEGRSFAPDSNQNNFRKWFAEIQSLDRQMNDSVSEPAARK